MSIWVPLAFYLAVTVVVPVLNGVGIDGAFVEHAGMVVAVVLGVAVLAAAAGKLCRHLAGTATSTATRQVSSCRQTRT